MPNTFNPPTTCRICGGVMQAGTLKTTRESYSYDKYPFKQLTLGELWYALEDAGSENYIVKVSEGGPFMVFHYRCTECGYLESYARGKYP